MMEPQMFRHERISLPEIKAKTTNGVRLYETPEGNKYPSITTVLSVRNKKGLFEWRKRVGEDVANHIARTAAARGTKVHAMCEDYLNNVHLEWPDKWKEHEKHFLPRAVEDVELFLVQLSSIILQSVRVNNSLLDKIFNCRVIHPTKLQSISTLGINQMVPPVVQ